MTRDALMASYLSAWDQFYSTEHMVDVLKVWRTDRASYWNRLFFFAAYLYASRVEHLHPMNCGFWTVRNRTDRRSGFPIEALIPFWWGRLRTMYARLRGIVTLFFQLEEVWLRSRPKTRTEDALQDLITKTKQDILDWRDIRTEELVALYEKLREDMPEVRVPSVVSLWFGKHNPFAGAYTRTHAERVWRRWYVHIWNPLKWIEIWLFEWVNGIRFLSRLLDEGR
jgi:hypothetical protein